jgi:hypothetical protein
MVVKGDRLDKFGVNVLGYSINGADLHNVTVGMFNKPGCKSHMGRVSWENTFGCREQEALLALVLGSKE